MGGLAIILGAEHTSAEREAGVRRMLRAGASEPLSQEPVASIGPCTLGGLTPPGTGGLDPRPWLASAGGGRYHATLCGELFAGPDLSADLGFHQLEGVEQIPARLVAEAFAHWGGTCLRRLRGAYGLAVWDGEEQQLLLARDALGVRTLYFAQVGNTLVASTDLRSVCASGLVPTDLSEEAVRDCLVHGSPVAPRTIYRRIHALRPGECLTWHAGRLETKTYWSFRDFNLRPEGTADTFLDEFRHRLQVSVRRSIGAPALTGCAVGNDVSSCLLVGSAARVVTTPLRTFSLCYADEMHRGEDLGPRIGRHFGTRHESVLIDGAQVAKDLEHILASYDQPGEDALSTFYLGRAAASAGLSVLLSPLGAEAVLGIHPWFNAARPPAPSLARRLAGVGRGLRHLLKPGRDVAQKLGDLRRSGGSLHELAALQRRQLSEGQRESLLISPGPFAPHDELGPLSREIPQENEELIGSAWDLRTRLAALELPDHRRSATAQAVALRVPFVDLELIEWCRTHPGAARQALQPTSGFPSAWSDLLLNDLKLSPQADDAPPYERWWHGPLRGFGEQVFSENSINQSGLFRADHVRALWLDALAHPGADWRLLWRLAILLCFVNHRTRPTF